VIDHKLTSNTEWFLKNPDGVALYNRAHPMTAAAFRAVMADSLNEIFSRIYDDHPDEWSALYGSAELSSDALEEIEIEIPTPRGLLK
jgi:hypothetical protein